MMRHVGQSVVITAMVVATTVTIVTADDVSTSDEDLRQALALVDILKSGILRRSQRRFSAAPGSLADFAGYRPWPPPETPFYGYGPYRRMSEKGDFELRKDKNITRQMEYEDPYGPAPGIDERVTAEQTTKKTTSGQPKKSDPPPTKAKTTKATANKTAETKKVTTTTTKKVTANPTVKIKTKKPTKINTKPKSKIVTDKTASIISPSTEAGIIKLKYNKNSAAKNAIANKRADEAEITEAAIELKRETADMRNIAAPRCVLRRTNSRPGRTGAPQNETQACVGPHCKADNATRSTAVRFKATTRVYLSRSVRPPIPLPANNAFCYTNPENALCRTLI